MVLFFDRVKAAMWTISLSCETKLDGPYHSCDCISTLTPIRFKTAVIGKDWNQKLRLIHFPLHLTLSWSSLSFSFSCSLRTTKIMQFFVHYVSASFQTQTNSDVSLSDRKWFHFSFIFVLFHLVLGCAIYRKRASTALLCLPRSQSLKEIALLKHEALECDWCKQKVKILYLVIWNAAKAKADKTKGKKNVAGCVSDKKGMLSFRHESVCSRCSHINNFSLLSMFPYFFSRAFGIKRRGHETREWKSEMELRLWIIRHAEN